jgi:succinoglycan biosynthesis protein ExoA
VSLLVVIPCLNEEAHLPGLLDVLCADPAAAGARIVVVDGGSSDASARIVRQRAEQEARISLLHNPARVQSAGVNLAVRTFGADSEFFVRVDAHAAYPADFLTRLAQAQAETDADSVVVSMRAAAAPDACFQQAAACAQNSVLGAGGSPHRKGGARRWVDHGHHALFKTAAFLAAGGYDESFTHNEDAEFDVRLASAGGKILLAGDILIDYFPRSTARALARQYFRYGQGRARTALKHRTPLKLRQLAPAAVAPAALVGLSLGPLAPVAAAPLALWLAACLVYGAALGVRQRGVCAAAAGFAAAIMHFAWSLGFVGGAAAGMLDPRGLRQRAA